MHTENTVLMHGDKDRIFALASRIEDWPRILPHYRDVRILEQSSDGLRRVVEMAAWRDDFPAPGVRFPVRWKSVQICKPETREVEFVHTGGIATGMYVVWTLQEAEGGGVAVSIRHDLQYPFRPLNGWFARELVGHQFIESIASKTLATIKRIVEEEASHSHE